MGPMSPVLKQGEGIKEGGLWVCCGDKAPLSQLPFFSHEGVFSDPVFTKGDSPALPAQPRKVHEQKQTS